jgi:hypothetical protein
MDFEGRPGGGFDVLKTAKKFSDLTQFRSRPGDVPLAASTEAGRTFSTSKVHRRPDAGDLPRAELARFKSDDHPELYELLSWDLCGLLLLPARGGGGPCGLAPLFRGSCNIPTSEARNALQKATRRMASSRFDFLRATRNRLSSSSSVRKSESSIPLCLLVFLRFPRVARNTVF